MLFSIFMNFDIFYLEKIVAFATVSYATIITDAFLNVNAICVKKEQKRILKIINIYRRIMLKKIDFCVTIWLVTDYYGFFGGSAFICFLQFQ